MPAVHDNHRPGPSALGGIHQAPLVFGIILEPFHRGGIGADNRNDSLGRDTVAESDVDQFSKQVSICFFNWIDAVIVSIFQDDASMLFDVLDLLTDLFNFRFNVNNPVPNFGLLRFGPHGIKFPV